MDSTALDRRQAFERRLAGRNRLGSRTLLEIRRRQFLVAAAALLSAPLAGAQAEVRRIGVLMPGPAPQYMDWMVAALRELGWIVGKNLLIETRYTQGDLERTEELARKLEAEGAALIATHVTGTAIAAHRATKAVPIVLLTSGYPVEGGLAQSLARPGGRVTGLSVYAGGGALFGKFLELLRQLVPSMRELGVLWGYAPPLYTEKQVAPATDELRRAAGALNVSVRFWQTGRRSDLEAALAAAAAAPLDALFVTAGVIHAQKEIAPQISDFVLRRRLPVLTDFAGGVFPTAAVLAYGANGNALAVRGAYYVDRILRGANPGELPIEQPTKFELSVNLKVAKVIGVMVPQSILLRADQVIE